MREGLHPICPNFVVVDPVKRSYKSAGSVVQSPIYRTVPRGRSEGISRHMTGCDCLKRRENATFSSCRLLCRDFRIPRNSKGNYHAAYALQISVSLFPPDQAHAVRESDGTLEFEHGNDRRARRGRNWPRTSPGSPVRTVTAPIRARAEPATAPSMRPS
jgi:hypothetical protein